MTNPWNLTPCVAQAVEAYLVHGSDKAVAHALGKSDNTITEQLRLACRKMEASTRVLMAVKYARWKWEQERIA